MSVHFRQTETSVILFGNTYPLRDQIKAYGGRFNGAEKNWRLPLSEETLAWANRVCQSRGGGQLEINGTEAGLMPVPAVLSRQVTQEVSTESTSDGATPTPDHPDTLSIGQLMDKIHRTIATNFADRLWISGEIQNTTDKKSGFFLDLAEGDSRGHANATVTIKAIIWRDSLQLMQQRHGKDKIDEVLQDGMKVRVRCQVQFYKERGQVSLIILDIDPSFTKGALALAREQLLKDLRAKGLADANKKLPLTPFPFRVGLISADNSRAKSDFIDQLQTLKFPGEVFFVPTPMQGEAVPSAVVRALSQLTKIKCDIIVLTRGGGSAADLRWFDAPEIAYAIAGSSIPILCAIGHHDDVCVAEDIAFRREKTPTAAADFVISCFVATKDIVDRLAATMAKNLEQRLELLTATTASLVERLSAAAMMSMQHRNQILVKFVHSIDQFVSKNIYAAGEACSRQLKRLSSVTDQAVFNQEIALQKFISVLAQLDPSPWLQKGWTRLQKRGVPIISTHQLEKGDELTTRFIDGRVTLTINHIDKIEPSKPSNTNLREDSHGN